MRRLCRLFYGDHGGKVGYVFDRSSLRFFRRGAQALATDPRRESDLVAPPPHQRSPMDREERQPKACTTPRCILDRRPAVARSVRVAAFTPGECLRGLCYRTATARQESRRPSWKAAGSVLTSGERP